jgi:hypothetical protein
MHDRLGLPGQGSISKDLAAGKIKVLPLLDLNTGVTRPVIMRVITPSTEARPDAPQTQPVIETPRRDSAPSLSSKPIVVESGSFDPARLPATDSPE